MGRVSVREAVANALANAAIPNVGTVFPARPEVAVEQDWEAPNPVYTASRFAEAAQTQSGSSAVLVVNLVSDKRQRRTLGGQGSNDTRIHETVLEVWFACTSGEAVQAQVDYDSIIDSIVALVRSNSTLSAPKTVWQAGEFQAGVEHQQAMPYTDADGMTVLIGGIVRWQTYEWIAGPVG